ncbi:MAG: branched-chain amino acid ABC transporter permease [Alphaproteobacteria bacterium]|nr:branched-chain amino acid ABC transporter permease [Alphaproteobacteria bacterium]
MALGYNLIYGVANILSFAHGALVVVGSFGMLAAYLLLGLPYPLAMAAGVLAAVLVGYLVEITAVRPVIRRGGTWGVMISTLGAALFIEFGIRSLTRGRPMPFPVPFEPVHIDLPLGAQVTLMQLVLVGAGAALLLALWLAVYRTRLGTAIQAIAQSPEIASCLGIDRFRIQFFTFAMASAAAGIAGVLYSIYYGQAFAFMGITLGLKGLVVMKVAGIGHLPGCVATGLMLGLIETMVIGYGESTYRDLVGYGWLLLVFMLKPQGLFGERGRARFESGAALAVKPLD